MGAFLPAARALPWALDLALLLALLVDVSRTPRPATLDVRRSLDPRAGLEQEFTRVVHIRAPRAKGLCVTLFEEFAEPFEVCARSLSSLATRRPELVPPLAADPTGGPDRAVVPADGRLELARVYRSRRRGVHGLGDMRLRLRGPLGLIERQSHLFGDQAIAIEPALSGLKNTLRLAANERWQELGVRLQRRRGGMTEFESLRDYVHGDDVRLVDWKAFAKRGRPIVRRYQQEQGQDLLLLIDCGRRMGATSAAGDERGWSKLDHALDAALEIGAVALQQGERVGVLAFDSALRRFLPPARGRRQLARLREAVFDLEASARESDLARALFELELRHVRRALLLVLSDVADPLSIERQRAALATGSRRHRIVFAGLDDPSLRRAAEGRGELLVGQRGAAFAVLAERRFGLSQLARSGARVIESLPAETAGSLLAAWFDERRAGIS